MKISSAWTYDAYENDFGINDIFTTNLKESCVIDFDLYFSLKYFTENVLVTNIVKMFWALHGWV